MKKSLPKILFFIFLILLTSCQKPSELLPDNQGEESVSPPGKVPDEKPTEPSYEDKVISTMSLDEKIGQLVIVGFPEGTQDEVLIKAIRNDKIGGFILFRRNYKNFKELYELNSKLKDWNKDNPLPLFISVDEEGGSVSRIPKDGVTIPDAKVFGNINDTALTERSGSVVGKQLQASGINLNFAPVLDILSISDNALLKVRAYGKDADRVSSHGISFIKGLTSEGIIAVPKHFPGHGNTTVDSHGSLPVIDITRSLMEERELIPFKNAVNKGIDAIMVGHLAFPQIDKSRKPATKSKIFLMDILRNELGFQGLAITDEIEMYGFMEGEQPVEDAVIESFNAGIDIFIIGHTKEVQDKVLQALKDGAASGLISEERINESLKRIIKVKKKYNISDEMNLDYEEAYKLFTNEENRKFLKEVKAKKKQ
ncbi:MAG: glycoside hydrolase family 3 protein [Lutispora sp.]|nr:glycoside hydrolase family 3 protein [Lutispora sp.]